MPEAAQNKTHQKQFEDKKYNQRKNWNKNEEPRQRRQYYFFHGGNKGHITRDCPDTKETQERIKNRANPQPLPQQPAREVNHTFAAPSQQPYCPTYPSLNSNQIHPSTLVAAYYPNFLPTWRPSTQQHGQASNRHAEANLTYINPRPPHITFIETNQPAQIQNRQLEALPLPPPPPQLAAPKNEPNLENQLNPHTPLPTIGMIPPIAEGSLMEFQTKKQKKDHLKLVNNIVVQGPVRCTNWSKTPIIFSEQDL
jgi:hypothetical protein